MKILYNEFFNVYVLESDKQLLQYKGKTTYIVGIINNKIDNYVSKK